MEWLLAPFPTARSGLEVGCGTGHFTEGLIKEGLRVVGFDRSPAMLAELRRRVPEIPVILGDAHRLPFREGAVDLTVKAAGKRMREIRWASTLFPNGLWRIRAPIPLGDVIGMAAVLTTSLTPP